MKTGFLSQGFSAVAFLPKDLLEQPLHLLCPLGFHGNLAAGFMSRCICVSDSCSAVLASSKTCVVSIAWKTRTHWGLHVYEMKFSLH